MPDRPSSQVEPSESLAAQGGGPPPKGDERTTPPPSDSARAARSTAAPAPLGTPNPSDKTVISQRPPVSIPAFRRAANPFEMGETLEGEQLGHFQLEQFVGGGGMGAVFRGTDLSLGRTVAIKVVSRDQSGEDALRRFQNEAQSAARLDHPNIARVYFVGEDKGWNYIVFEYIEGVNVRDLVDHNGPLPLEDAISYTLQIAEALEHASQRDVIHRDIKPSNILIMVDGRAKLVDMGLARLHQMDSSAEDLTASGVTLGTFDYISPEQARDPRNTDVRSDLYSLGCTLFFMLTGRPPFPDGTVLQKLLSHSSDEPPDLLEARPDLDAGVGVIVKKMLAKAPEHRFQAPRELIAELLLLADRLDMPGIRTSSALLVAARPLKPAWWLRHLPWGVPAMLLLLVVLIQQSWDRLATSRAPPPPRLASGIDAGPDTPQGVNDSSKKPDSRSKAAASPGEPRVEDGKPSAREPIDSERGGRDTREGASTGVTPDDPLAAPKSLDSRADDAPKERSPTGKPDDSIEKVNGAANGVVTPAPREPDTTTGGDPVDGRVESVPSAERASPRDPGVLVVSRPEDREDDEHLSDVASLEEALRRVGESPGFHVVELRFNGTQWIRPTEIPLHRLADRKLTIRAADGFEPMVAFVIDPLAAPPPGHEAMLRVRGGQLSWFDTHFHLELPPPAENGPTWSLFQLQSMDAMEFHRCTFTIRNLDSQGDPVPGRVSFFEVMPGGDLTELLWETDPLEGDTPTIRLHHCIARGQAALVRSTHAIPFWLVWEHGLFVSTERLIEVGGMMSEPRWGLGHVTLRLKRLLSIADQGICLMRTHPYPLGLTVRSQSCLIATRSQVPPVPLYLFQGSGPIDRDWDWLDISGSNNYYKNTTVVLRVESSEGGAALAEYTFDHLKSLDAAAWFSERNPQPATVFSWSPPEVSADRQQLDDFIQPGAGEGWFVSDFDIVPAELPQLPDRPGP